MSASKAIAVILFIALASLCGVAQTQEPAAKPENQRDTGTISGQVVDENDQGVPYARVSIQAIRSTNPNNKPQTVITNAQGEFVIKDLVPIDYGFNASAPSYRPGRPEPLRENGVYRVGDRVRLRLIKGGVVTGKVTDAFGKPVVGVNVTARMVRDTANRLLPRGQEVYKLTDDRGVYRIYGLWPGTFVVVAGGPTILVRNPDKYTFDLDVPTYAPSSTRDTAQEIIVRGAEEIGDVDIRYRGEQGRFISGEVTVPSNLHPGFSVTLMNGGSVEVPLSTTSSRGSSKGFSFKGVGDGEYRLIAYSSDSNGAIAISESMPVSVSGADVTGIQLTTKLLSSVDGRVVLDEPKIAECDDKQPPLSYEAFVDALPNDNGEAKQIPEMLKQLWSLGAPSRVDTEGKFLLKNVPPGQYYFGLRFSAPQWYVNSMAIVPPVPSTSPAVPNAKARSVDASRVWTNVKGSERSSNLIVTLVHGAASVQGTVVPGEGEQAPRNLFVYLVPAEREKANDVLRFFVEAVRSNGYIGISNIPPGRYWVIAAEAAAMPAAKLRSPHETETRKRLRLEAEAAKNEIELKPCQRFTELKLPLRPSSQN